MKPLIYVMACALSGCVWAAIAWVIGHEVMGAVVWGGIIASPLIGIAIGYLFGSMGRWPWLLSLPASLLSLLLAVSAFGMAMGLFDLARGVPGRIPWAVVAQAVVASLWGVTATGFLLFLWPLALLNHTLLCRRQPDRR